MIGLFLVMVLAATRVDAVTGYPQDTVRVSADFNRETNLRPDASLEMYLSLKLLASDGRVSFLIGEMDVSAFCITNETNLTYKPRTIRLPLGETSVIVYLVSDANQWIEIARLPLLVSETKSADAAGSNGSATSTPKTSPSSAQPTTANERSSPFKFVPSVSVNVKSQSTVLFFPDSSRPDRINFTDLALQTTLQGTYQRGTQTLENQFDLAGSTVQSEALRFGELGTAAPQIDLSSYSIQYQ